ncbi:hypothetical protein [Mesorhizobium sp. 1M-11]|uniref:hypothetical protein n=1 Tax=Mesorhizobium sp. 1M-11 TaxID=1529006 RepID=UPI0006C75A1E|nr:hypothetical protein [Mesorhizobium sp. 1M-11]
MTVHPSGFVIDASKPWQQTISGRAFPLTAFSALDIDLYGDVAESLARVCRFGGHVPGNAYSVLQHSVVGADAALEETGDALLAAYFLAHDLHEHIIGDQTTPVVNWLAGIELETFGSRDIVRTVLAIAKSKLDWAIWRAAGLPQPGKTYWERVKEFDVRMLATERRHLLMQPPASWGDDVENAKPIRLRGKLTAWPVAKAVEEFRIRLDRLCPNARRM